MILDELSKRSRDTLRAIHSLPMKIGLHTNILESYVTERKLVRTEKQLKAFTHKWNSVWKIPWDVGWTQKREERQLVSGRYNAKAVLTCMIKNTQDACSHVKNNRHCISADVLVPAFTLRLLQLRNDFGVPDSIALLQLTRFLHSDLAEQDPDNILQPPLHRK